MGDQILTHDSEDKNDGISPPKILETGVFPTAEERGILARHPTKTSGTKEQYLHRAAALMAKAADSLPLGTPINPEEIANWFTAESARISRNTLRFYRASLVYFMEVQVDLGNYDRGEVTKAAESMGQGKSGKGPEGNSDELCRNPLNWNIATVG